ncbi:hypothetical protein [Nicoliella lavandulae]|uniref:Uncharacterized protein n=1 Tax=Nicoliella lavandulae TaxID=3082954 RepID=A0ABU8SL42_9LACO
MQLLTPDELTALLNGTPQVKRAVAVLKDRFEAVDDDNPFLPKRITSETIRMAQQLAAANLFTTKLDLNDYRSVHAFIVRNDKYLNADAKNLLLGPFN